LGGGGISSEISKKRKEKTGLFIPDFFFRVKRREERQSRFFKKWIFMHTVLHKKNDGLRRKGGGL